MWGGGGVGGIYLNQHTSRLTVRAAVLQLCSRNANVATPVFLKEDRVFKDAIFCKVSPSSLNCVVVIEAVSPVFCKDLLSVYFEELSPCCLAVLSVCFA